MLYLHVTFVYLHVDGKIRYVRHNKAALPHCETKRCDNWIVYSWGLGKGSGEKSCVESRGRLLDSTETGMIFTWYCTYIKMM